MKKNDLLKLFRRGNRFLKIICINLLVFILIVALFDTLNYFTKLVKTPDDLQKHYSDKLGWPLSHVPYYSDAFNGHYSAHPLFSYVNNYNFPWVNNYGFTTHFDYPYEKKHPKDIVVGIYGASVADIIYPSLSKEFLIAPELESLRKCGYEFNLMNFAMASSREPIPHYIFLHSSDWVDVFIKLDGFNEANEIYSAYRPVDFPVFSSELYNLDNDKLKYRQRSLRIRKVQYIMTKLPLDFPFLKASTSYFLFYNFAFNFLETAYQKNVFLINKTGRKILKKPLTNFKIDQKAVQVWSKYTLYQDLIAKNSEKLNFNFIQPNQYNGKFIPMSEDEKKIVFSESFRRNQKVTRLFNNIRNEVLILKKKNVEIFDYAEFFNERESEIFVDNCCHFNEKGNELLSKAIIKQISSQLKNKFKCSNADKIGPI